jgi:ribosomal protein L6P/L9E
MFLGFYKNYFYFLKLKGMGFKLIGHPKGVIFKLGYSHKLLVLKISDVCFFYLTKQLFQIKGRSGFFLKNLISSLIQLRKTTVYKKKGVFLKGSIIQLKLTSKKSKF